MDRPAALITEQGLRIAQPGTHIINEPAQDQIEMIQHRHPPGPRPRPPGTLAETDMNLAKRPPPEMQIGQLQRSCLIGTQATVIQRPKQRIVTARGTELAGRRDPIPKETEEVLHPFHRRRRLLRRRVITHMPGRVELVDNLHQTHTERRLNLCCLTRNQEPVEILERLHITATR